VTEIRDPGAPLIFPSKLGIRRHGEISPRNLERVTADDWQIVAECPGIEPVVINGLTSKAEVDEWLSGDRKIAWLRSKGYAK
jgi:hypothetical protein